jgi:GMP synthase (glutamine-hydrolysing)
VKTVAAIRHVHFEGLGALESVLSDAGYEVRYHEAGIDDLQSPQLASCELLAVLGGPIGVYEEEKYPFSSTTGISVTLRSETARPAPEAVLLGQQRLREWLSAFDSCSQPGKGF